MTTESMVLTTLAELLERWRVQGRPGRVVFTNGCFDLLHPGHTRYLAAARKLGDALVVGLNDDQSVRRLKGAFRPFLTLAVRGELLAALDSVDYVVPFTEDTPRALIEALRPAVLVKGGDYLPDQIVGAAQVPGWGGVVRVLPLEADFSTTALALTVARAVRGEFPEVGLDPGTHRPYGPGMGEAAAGLKTEREKTIREQARDGER